MCKPIPVVKKFQKTLNSVFSGPKVLLLCLKSVPWTGNELAGDDVENCVSSLLTNTKPSHLSLTSSCGYDSAPYEGEPRASNKDFNMD